MKDILKKYQKPILATAAIWIILISLFFINMAFSLSGVSKFIGSIKLNENANAENINWNNPEIRNLYKEKLWLEQQVALAKSDSFSLGINLNDSLVQVQLKGTVLFQSKIVCQKPSTFLGEVNRNIYLNYCTAMSRIDSSLANIPKKPIKKVIAPPVGTEKEITKPDTIKTERLTWEFITDNHIKVIINGIDFQSDSVKYEIPVKSDIRNYLYQKGFTKFFSTDYTPTLFLWLNDAEAKSIYRAIPDNARLIFRN